MRIERLGLSVGDIVTHRQAAEGGVPRSELARLVAAGAIARLAPGVYRAGPADGLDLLAASLALRGAGKLQSAAAWQGADMPFAVPRVHITTSRNRGRRADCRDGIQLHRADLPSRDRHIVRGCEVTVPVRTFLDIARSSPLGEAVAIGDSLCRMGQMTVGEAAAAAHSLPPAPGRAAAIAAAALLDALAESVFESVSRVDISVAGLPMPIAQYTVYDLMGRWLARVDFAWPELRIVLECDGYEFHKSREQFEADRERWTALTCAGWTVVVVTWRQVLAGDGYLAGVLSSLMG